jgi:alpha-beta hydrolase superfamily lysophospholipase
MPPSWGAGGLLHPYRRRLTTPRPAGAEDVEIVGAGGVKLRGWRFAGAGRRGTVVYLHGSSDNRASGLALAQRYTARGFDVLLYDSRAHGESEGEACTFGYYEKDDLRRAIDGIRNPPVIAIGVSLGGAVALQAAAVDRRITAVIAVATFSDLRTVATERAPRIASARNIDDAFRLAEQMAHFRVDDVNPAAMARDIHVPVMLIHGQDDHETPPEHSRRVFAALNEPKRLLLVPGAGHNDVLRSEVWTAIDEWVDGLVAASPSHSPGSR